jgi:precorrin-6B methylase 2
VLNNQSTLIKNQFQANKLSWVKSFQSGLSQDQNGNYLPWMTYPFIAYLSSKLNSKQTIFEYGCGSSTLFFATKVAKVVALESNKTWYEIIKQKLLEARIKNVELIYFDNALQDGAYEIFASKYQGEFDLVIIDSLKRFACATNSINAIKPGGAIILDDSERKNYRKIFDFFLNHDFIQKDFPGIAPGGLKIKNSTIFYRLNNIFS